LELEVFNVYNSIDLKSFIKIHNISYKFFFKDEKRVWEGYESFLRIIGPFR
jgi:hypothetical protein